MLIGKRCSYLELWNKFLTAKKDAGKLIVVTKDLWDQFYELLELNGGDLSKTEDDGSWPTLIDEFCREQKVF